jgi:ribosome-associated protein
MPDSNSPLLPDDSSETSKEVMPSLPRRARFHDVQDESVPEAVTRSSPDRQAKALELARLAARIGHDNRARDIELLDLRQSTPLFDFFVVITAPSRRQANAIVSEIDHEMKQREEFKLGIEGSEEGRWTLIDYGDFVVHVFSEDARDFYAIEDIWGDAPRLEWRAEAPPTALHPATDSDTSSPTD